MYGMLGSAGRWAAVCLFLSQFNRLQQPLLDAADPAWATRSPCLV
jgi:hypothetical protein